MVPKLPDVVRGVAVGPWVEHAARLLGARPLPVCRLHTPPIVITQIAHRDHSDRAS